MNIAILGYGVVGKGVEKLCLLNDMNVSYILMHPSFELTKPNMTYKIEDILKDSSIDLVVECIGGYHPAYDYVKASIETKKHVVSSNKKMLAKYLIELNDLANKNNVHLLFSSACGGGIPWLKELSSISNADKITSFMGIMNGTSNYILYKMLFDKSDFKASLKNAQTLGYAEADPSEDISGIDTANKTLLSAAICFKRYFSLDDIYIKGIKNINNQDINYALDNNYQLALIGKGININNKYCLSVLPTFVSKNKVLGNISLNNNCFILSGEALGEVSFIGQGAGSLPTANNIIRDIQSIDNPYVLNIIDKGINDLDLIKSNYYIRTNNHIDDKYIENTLADNSYITKKITINDLKQIIFNDEECFFGEILND